MTSTPTAQSQQDLDETVEASFPASDPPAVWTWDVEPAATERPGAVRSS